MKTIYSYPGSFCPPTYGHLQIVKEAAKQFPHVTIFCSNNEEKKDTRWFNEKECKEMWECYNLPKNVSVRTLSEFMKKPTDFSNIVMIRGIRSEKDLAHEQKVMMENSKLGIDKYFFIYSDCNHTGISSSKVRELTEANKFDELHKYVAPGIISKLIERQMKLKNIFMVVGKPATGKSTFLAMLNQIDFRNVHINTDEFNKKVRPILEKAYGSENLVKMAIQKEDEFRELIRAPWMKMLYEAIEKNSEFADNLFVEIPYGLSNDKLMFRFIGSKVIYFGCDESIMAERNKNRMTPEYIVFSSKIPGEKETKKISERYKLDSIYIDTDDLNKFHEISREFLKKIKNGG